MSDVSHDHLFKQVLGEFFPEFMELFFPQAADYLDPDSVEHQPLEVFADLLEGKALSTDVVVKVKFRGQDSFFIIHVEHQARFYADLDRRVFQYFTLLYQDYRLPVYPIVIFSHGSPRAVGDRSFAISFPDWEVLRFNYRVIRLNHLRWRDFLGSTNPVASAFMAKMKMARRDRPFVKLACLQALAAARVNEAQLLLLSGFIDTYLKLEEPEEKILQAELDKIEPGRKEVVMQIVTSWMEKGIEQEQEQSRIREISLVTKLLRSKFGGLSEAMADRLAQLSIVQVEQMGDVLMGFEGEEDLGAWLAELV